MAQSKHASKRGRILPKIQEGERVFIFHGPILREAECVRVAIEDKQVKYLVRYRPGSGMVGLGPMGMAPIGMPALGLGPLGPMGMGPLSPLGAMGLGNMWLGGAAVSPYPLPGSSIASTYSLPMASGASPYSLSGLSSMGPIDGTLAGTSYGICSTGPSTSSMGLSTNFSMAGPSTSAGPSVSSSFSDLLSSLGWNYEWIPENRVLRFCNSGGRDSDGDEQERDDSLTTRSGASGHTSDVGKGSTHGDGKKECKREAATDPREGSEDDAAQPPFMSTGFGAPERKFLKREEIKVPIPNALKPLLVKDWELVNNNKSLFKLPAQKTVNAILAEYTVFQQNCGLLTKQYAVHDLVAGIKEYFNVLLGTQLLYKFERPQYTEIMATLPNMQASQIYGGAHLLRLFVQLGSVLAYSTLDDNSLTMVLSHLQDFLKYLACNPSLLFTPEDYQVASAEYQQIAE